MEYALIDSGAGQKLERFGPLSLIRPSAHAIWSPRLARDMWKKADGRFSRSGNQGWEPLSSAIPDKWTIDLSRIRLQLKPTPFGHIGFFPEHMRLWDLLFENLSSGMRVLNVFGYTGALSLVAAKAGASVCHVDAAQGIVDWARDNARLNQLEGIRWIVEDAQKFALRLKKREERFDAIILDPPTFGRGKKGEVFKVEQHLLNLLSICVELMSQRPAFLILSCHTPGFTRTILQQLLTEAFEDRGGHIEAEELHLEGPFLLPSGAFAIWKP